MDAADFRLPPYEVQQLFVTLAETVDWGLKLLDVPELWKKTKGEGAVVAVLDTGIAASHQDLRDQILDLADFTGSRSGPIDVQGHGTHVAGTILAAENNAGVVGVAPKAKLLSAKVLGDNGSGSLESVARGIRWAIDKKADIISMSLGSSQGATLLHQACKEAAQAGVLAIAAAGNCLAEGQQVWTSRGPVPIETLRPGDRVYSYDRPDIVAETTRKLQLTRGPQICCLLERQRSRVREKLVEAPVVRLIDNGRRPVYRLRTLSREILATGNHPFLVCDRQPTDNPQRQAHSLVWKELKDLNPGDIVVVQKSAPPAAGSAKPIPSDAMIELAGMWLGDGWTRLRSQNRGSVHFAMPAGSKRRRLLHLLRQAYPEFEPSTRHKVTVSLHRRQVADDFTALGLTGKSKTKKVPDWVFDLPEEKLRLFMNGYIAADGHRRAVPTRSGNAVQEINFCLANEVMASQLRFLCVRLGWRAGPSRERVRKNIKIFNGYRVCHYAEARSWEFRAYPEAAKNAEGVDGGLVPHAWRRTSHLGVEVIRSVEHLGIRQTYDIEVEGTHNFVAEGLVVHNSGPSLDTVNYPALYPEVAAVGAIDQTKRIANFSSRGVTVDIAAPGVDITSTYPPNNYARLSGTCLAKGSWVYGPAGPKLIEEVGAGDIVFAFKDGRLVERVVSACHYRGRATTQRLLSRGRDVRATASHEMLVLDLKARDLDWVRFGALREHHRLVLPRELRTQVNPYLDATLPEEFCWLLGFFAGDGWLCDLKRGRRVQLATGDEPEVIQKARNAYFAQFGKQFKQSKCGRWEYDDSTKAAMIVEALGLNAPAKDKTLPLWVWSLSRPKQMAFYRGCLAADGSDPLNKNCKTRKHIFECDSSSLIRRLAIFADYQGWAHGAVRSRTRVLQAPGSKAPRETTSHILNVNPERELEGWGCLRPKFVRTPGREFARQMGVDVDNFSTGSWQVAEEESRTESVYDLTVPDADCFVTQGLVTHNSMAAPFVSGVAALLVSLRKKAGSHRLTMAEFLKKLQQTATDLGAPGHDTAYGYGLINPDSLLALSTPAPTPEPPGEIGLPELFLEAADLTESGKQKVKNFFGSDKGGALRFRI